MNRIPRDQQPIDERSGRYAVDQWADTETALRAIPAPPTPPENITVREDQPLPGTLVSDPSLPPIVHTTILVAAYLAAAGLVLLVIAGAVR
jgi:hypothetical protein